LAGEEGAKVCLVPLLVFNFGLHNLVNILLPEGRQLFKVERSAFFGTKLGNNVVLKNEQPAVDGSDAAPEPNRLGYSRFLHDVSNGDVMR